MFLMSKKLIQAANAKYRAALRHPPQSPNALAILFISLLISAQSAFAQCTNWSSLPTVGGDYNPDDYARIMPGFPVKGQLIDENINKHPSLGIISQVLLKNAGNKAQNGKILWDRIQITANISMANCKSSIGKTLKQCCGTKAKPQKGYSFLSWTGTKAEKFAECEAAFDAQNGKCIEGPLLSTGKCVNEDTGAEVVIPAARNSANSFATPGKWVQDDNHLSMYKIGFRLNGDTEEIRVTSRSGKRTKSEAAKAFKLCGDGNLAVNMNIFCGITSTGFSSNICEIKDRPVGYTSGIPGCNKNAEGEILSDEPCISKMWVAAEFDTELGITEDAGAIMGGYFGFPYIWGAGEGDRNRIMNPFNSGLPF